MKLHQELALKQAKNGQPQHLHPWARSVSDQVSNHLARRSRRFVSALPQSIERVIPYWICAVIALSALKMAAAPMPPASFQQFADIFLPYAFLALAPTLALRLSNLAYPEHARSPRLKFHLCAVGKWRSLSDSDARQAPAFGPYGLMACLLLGLLLNVPVRAFEFFLAIPAIHAAAPAWGRAIFMAMTVDVVAMSFLYVVCFVMALRGVALFPRMLLSAWMIDICFQLSIAQSIAMQPDLPSSVAAPLAQLLTGNVTKVLVSMVVWLPYLILSDRINLTYRRRVRLVEAQA